MRYTIHPKRTGSRGKAGVLLPALAVLILISVVWPPGARAMHQAVLPDAGQVAAAENGGFETYWHMGELFVIVYSNDPKTLSRVDYIIWYWEMRGVTVRVFFALIPEEAAAAPGLGGHFSFWFGFSGYPWSWCGDYYYWWGWVKPPPGDGWVPPPGRPPLRPWEPVLKPADPPLLLARTMYHQDGTTSTVRFALRGRTVLDERAIAVASGEQRPLSVGQRIAGALSFGGGNTGSSASGSSSFSSSSSGSSSGPSSSSGGGGGVSSRK